MSSQKVRRVDFYPDEWIAGTVCLDNAERGLYITACALIYSHGGPVEIDHLKRTCGDHGRAFNRQLDRLLKLGKLILNGTKIANKRALNELENSLKRIENASKNGTKGNEIKKVAAATRSGAANANYQLPTTNDQIYIDRAKALSPARRARSAEDEFSSIYAVYPRHVGRGAALKAFIRARQTVDLDTLREAVERYALQRAGEEPRFTPHMATWLNGQRWADEDGNSNHEGVNGYGRSDAQFSEEERQAGLQQALAELRQSPQAE